MDESRLHPAPVDEPCRKRFEAAWVRGRPLSVEECLPPLDDPRHLATLEELVHIDIEFAWKQRALVPQAVSAASNAAQPVTVEAYLRRFPRLNRPEVRERLGRHEAGLRRRHFDSGAKDPDSPGDTSPGELNEIDSADHRFDPTLTFLAHTADRLQPPADSQTYEQIRGIFSPGILLNDRYELKRELGRGGMGVVFLGHDQRLDRPVAIKVIRPSQQPLTRALQEHVQSMFAEEARLGANLLHPAIATVFDYGFHGGMPTDKLDELHKPAITTVFNYGFQGELSYIVFEYVAGLTLREFILRRAPMPLEDVQLIVGPLAQALDFAHRRRVVHRDLKPDNIRATEQGAWKILDLGLAKRFDREENWSFAGTPAYCAPEQAAELPSDGRTDQYAFAVIVFEMLTGMRPFESKNPLELLAMHREQPPKLPNGCMLPPAVRQAVLKGLSKNPDDRFATCEDFAVALGSRMFSPIAGAGDILLEAEAWGLRLPFFPAFRNSRRVRLLLQEEALWALRDGMVYRWPMALLSTVWASGRKLQLSFQASRGTERRQWEFAKKEMAQQWQRRLLELLPPSSKQKIVSRDAAPQSNLAVLLSNRPEAPLQLLGQVEATDQTRRRAEETLVLRGAVLGADAVVDLAAERVHAPRQTEWRCTGKAVKAVNREGLQQLGTRWLSQAVIRVGFSMLRLAAVLLGILLVAALIPLLASNLPPLPGILGAAIPLLRRSVETLLLPLLCCIAWPIALGTVSAWLRWPQLVRPTAIAVVAFGAAPLAGNVAAVALRWHEPLNWYGLVGVAAECGALLLLAWWLFAAGRELWSIDRRARRLFGEDMRVPARTRWMWGVHTATLGYSLVILFFMGVRAFQQVELSSGDNIDLAAEMFNDRFSHINQRRLLKQLNHDDAQIRAQGLANLAKLAKTGQALRAFPHLGRAFDSAEVLQAANRALSDPDPKVQAAAKRALEEVEKKARSRR